jgi:hypothetical protein
VIASTQLPEARGDEAMTLEPGLKQLFLDEHAVEEMKGLRRRMHQPEKKGPVLKADVPSDGEWVQTVSAPMWVADEGAYKMVYECHHEGRNYWAIATSKDGVHWEKPHVGAVEFKGSKQNNLIASPGGRLWQVVYDRDDPDPQRRYKGFLGHSGRKPVVSSDGIHWRELDAPSLPSFDAGTLCFDRERRLFLGLLKTEGRYGRVYNISVSEDFVHWSEPRFFFGTDDKDQELALGVIRRRLADPGLARPLFIDPDPAVGWEPPAWRKKLRWVARETWRAECYNIGIFPYEGVYLAWLMIYYPTGTGLPQRNNTDGFHLIQLAMTRDLGEPLVRLGDRETFLGASRIDEKGLVGNYDRLQLQITNHPVEHDDELWFYYCGFKRRARQHDRWTDGSRRDPSTLSALERADWIEDTHSAICLAVLRRDGFISLEADEDGGKLVTKPFVAPGKALFVNLDVHKGGAAKVEVLGDDGKPLEGFALDSSVELTGDAVRQQVLWKESAHWRQLRGRTVRLGIQLNRAHLYAFWVEE